MRTKIRRISRDPLRLAGLLGLAALALTIFVAIDGVPLPGDISLARRTQEAIGPGLEPLVDFVNGAGDEPRWVALAIATVLAVAGIRLGAGRPPITLRHQALATIVVAWALSPGSAVLKRLLDSPRPTLDFGLEIDGLFDRYGFPSGHVYGDTLLYGAIAVCAPALLHPRLVLPARLVAATIIVLSGPARVEVGAHWPSDVLGGYLWGGAALCLAAAAGLRARR
jgi:membrane-associated phospholipid phosphatase